MVLQEPPGRRGVVRSVAALLGASLAGCTGDADTEASSQPEDTPIGEACEREHQRVPDLVVRNRASEPYVVTLAVTGEREDGSSEPFFEDTYDLQPDDAVREEIAFDPDADDIERYDDFVATASIDDGQTDSTGIYSTVVSSPINHDLSVVVDSDGELVVREMHSDYDGGRTPPC